MVYYDKDLNCFRGRANGEWVNLGGCIELPPPPTGGATFPSTQDVSVASIYDDTTSEIVDITGVIDNATNQITFNVPYTSGTGSYEAYTSSYIASASGSSESGSPNGFKISYPAGNFSSSGTIPVTIEVDGDGTFDPKKLPIGNTLLIASIPFNVNRILQTTINLRIITTPRDMKFGAYSTAETAHYGSCSEPSNAFEDPQLAINMTDEVYAQSAYASRTLSSGLFLEIDLGASYLLDGVKISGGSLSCWATSFKGYLNSGAKIQYFDTNSGNWVDIVTVTGVNDTSMTEFTFTAPIEAQRIRVLETSWLAVGNFFPVGYY
jgi:hypothetical protein